MLNQPIIIFLCDIIIMIRSLEQIRADTLAGIPPPDSKKPKAKKKSEVIAGTKNPDPDIVNMYELKRVQLHMEKNTNPHFDDHKIKLFFNGIIVGASGSGKTNSLCTILKKFDSTFHKIYIFTNECEEPIYKYLQDFLPSWQLHMSYDGYTGYLNFLRDSKRNKEKSPFFGQSVVIFDDMACEKDQTEICNQYKYGRKRSTVDGLGCCTFYLSQTYSTIPAFIRGQATLIIVVKVDNKNALEYLMRSVSLGTTKKQLYNMYEYMRAKEGFGNFLMINTNANDESRIRVNFSENLLAEDF
jgi:hypothetical protein